MYKYRTNHKPTDHLRICVICMENFLTVAHNSTKIPFMLLKLKCQLKANVINYIIWLKYFNVDVQKKVDQLFFISAFSRAVVVSERSGTALINFLV